jgi:anion-transporting  ArsA/GET3 family ATPase
MKETYPMPPTKSHKDVLPEGFEGEDVESLIQFLSTMNQSLLSQGRSTSNTMASILRTLNTLQADLQQFMTVNDLTRERRFQEEIDAMEAQLAVISKQLEEKKNARVDLKSTTDKVRTVAREELAERDRKRSIDWLAVRQTAINASAGALAVAILWAIVINLPAIAEGLKTFLGK